MRPDADDLTALERHLAGCRPSAAGLDADAMLFAAGQAAARRPRVVWPATAGAFATLSLILGLALVGERSERVALAARLDRQPTIIVEKPVAVPSSPAPDSYLAARRQIEMGDEAWFAHPDAAPESTPPSPAAPAVLHAWPSTAADLQP
jgi:hypothetical protein